MESLDQLLGDWKKNPQFSAAQKMDATAWQQLIKTRTLKQKSITIRYFWAYFVFQLIIYGILSHIIIVHWQDKNLVLACLVCLLIYLPFTVILMRRFKKLAIIRWAGKKQSNLPLIGIVETHYRIIKRFFLFKWWYELFLVPVSSVFFVYIFFRIYFAGGVGEHLLASFVLFVVVTGASILAIFLENKRNFKEPMYQLKALLHDLETQDP